MSQPVADPTSARIDVRLVPAALTGWLVTAAGIVWPRSADVVAVAGVLLILGAVAGRLGGGPPALGAILTAVGAVAVGFGLAVALRTDAVEHHPVTAAFGTVTAVTVTPTESSFPAGSTRLMFRATLQRLGADPASGRVVVFAPALDFSAVMVGQPVAFRARVTRPARHDLSVAALNATGRPTVGRAGPVSRAAHAVRARFAAAAQAVLPADQAAMLPALVLGDTTAVSAATDGEFRAAGLTHLMAVSGANVTIVCGAALFSARLVGPRTAVGLATVTLVGFVIVVQPTASVLRAAVMGAIALLGVLSSRRRQAIPSLSAAVLVLLVAAPQLAVDVGFALSVVATATLVVVAPVWSRRLVDRRWPKPLADAVAIAVAAQLVTAPLIAGISGRVSVVSAGANLVVAALVAPITVLGSAAAALCGFWPAAAQLLIRFTGPEVWWVCLTAHGAGSLPGATVPVPAGALGAVTVGAVTAAAVAGWRWRWCRRMVAVAGLCLLAWSLAGLLADG